MINVENLVKKRKESVHVKTDNIRTGILFKNSAILKNTNSWHAFILHNVGKPSRNETLKIVLDHLYPIDLIPVKFEVHGKDCMFMARNCTEAIEKLCNDNLIIPHKRNPIKCEIILQYSTLNLIKVDIQKNISTVLYSLFNINTRVLNLNNFSCDPDLNEYCPLSQPKIMYYVLHIAAGIHPASIILTNNEIKTLSPLEALGCSTSLTSLNLRNNKIDENSSLETLRTLNLTEIWLDGNPLCNLFNEHTYVEKIKELIPKIEILDGVCIIQNGVPTFKKNSLCDQEGYALVEHFLEYYFTFYDNNRRGLEGLYYQNAQFSITNFYKQGQSTSSTARLRPYQMNNRNLLAMADISRSEQFLIRGNSAITHKLLDLPRTEHDPFSFTVDLMYYSDKTAVLNINGTFREMAQALLDSERILSFNRTFVLVGANGEYSIVNDMLHVYNSLTTQAKNAFKSIRQRGNKISPLPVTSKEKEAAVQAVEMAAGVTKEWAEKLLQPVKYDVVKCLKTFIEKYKIDKIPSDAFKD